MNQTIQELLRLAALNGLGAIFQDTIKEMTNDPNFLCSIKEFERATANRKYHLGKLIDSQLKIRSNSPIYPSELLHEFMSAIEQETFYWKDLLEYEIANEEDLIYFCLSRAHAYLQESVMILSTEMLVPWTHETVDDESFNQSVVDCYCEALAQVASLEKHIKKMQDEWHFQSKYKEELLANNAALKLEIFYLKNSIGYHECLVAALRDDKEKLEDQIKLIAQINERQAEKIKELEMKLNF